MSKKEYFLFGDKTKLESAHKALCELHGYMFAMLDNPSLDPKYKDFFRNSYHPIKDLKEALDFDVPKIVNIENLVKSSKENMVKELMGAMANPSIKTPEDLFIKLNLILSKYEVIGIDSTAPGGSDDHEDLPF